MDPYSLLPEKKIEAGGDIAQKFRQLGILSFQAACAYVNKLPYGYNSDRDDIMILFKEGRGSCTTKHAVIATLARELGLPVNKNVGIYAMTEALVTGTAAIVEKYGLPYLPMIHCYLVYDRYRIDLTEGNRNGKNSSIDQILCSLAVQANIPAKDEYLFYRNALKNDILKRTEFKSIELKTILLAREEGLSLLKDNLKEPVPAHATEINGPRSSPNPSNSCTVKQLSANIQISRHRTLCAKSCSRRPWPNTPDG